MYKYFEVFMIITPNFVHWQKKLIKIQDTLLSFSLNTENHPITYILQRGYNSGRNSLHPDSFWLVNEKNS